MRAEVEPLVALVAPFAPHVAEELWERLGHEGSIFDGAHWPAYDEAKTVDDTVKVAVQVNGKLRGTVDVAPGAGGGRRGRRWPAPRRTSPATWRGPPSAR